jgi:hypothetical protein
MRGFFFAVLPADPQIYFGCPGFIQLTIFKDDQPGHPARPAPPLIGAVLFVFSSSFVLVEFLPSVLINTDGKNKIITKQPKNS